MTAALPSPHGPGTALRACAQLHRQSFAALLIQKSRPPNRSLFLLHKLWANEGRIATAKTEDRHQARSRSTGTAPDSGLHLAHRRRTASHDLLEHLRLAKQ